MVPEIFQFYQGGFFVQQSLYYVTWTVEAKNDTDFTAALCGNTEKGERKSTCVL